MNRLGGCIRRNRNGVLRLAICLLLAGAPGVRAADTALDVPHFRQQENGCGAAALAMVMHYWSGHYSLPAAMSPAPDAVYQRLYREKLRGIRLVDMQEYAADRHYYAFTLKGTAGDLRAQLEKKRPVIVALSKRPGANRHFAVVVGIDGDRVWLNDPTRKKQKKMKLSRFEKRWSAAERWLLLVAPKDLPAPSSSAQVRYRPAR